MIDERKIELMTRLVDEYISSAHPVGSLLLVERYRLTWSTATIRNEMALLEEAGYMFQPYTSAGRVPTDQGYRLYIEHLKPSRLTPKLTETLEHLFRSLHTIHPTELKKCAHGLSQISGEIAFVASDEGVACSGIAHLASKPEFHDHGFMQDMGLIIDNIEKVVEKLALHLGTSPTLFIGDQRFFSSSCSAVVVSIPFKKTRIIVGLVGPLRMNYAKNIALLTHLHSFTTNH